MVSEEDWYAKSTIDDIPNITLVVDVMDRTLKDAFDDIIVQFIESNCDFASIPGSPRRAGVGVDPL